MRLEINEESEIECVWPNLDAKKQYDSFIDNVLDDIDPRIYGIRAITVEGDDHMVISFPENPGRNQATYVNMTVTRYIQALMGASRIWVKDLNEEYGERLNELKATETTLDAEIAGQEGDDAVELGAFGIHESDGELPD